MAKTTFLNGQKLSKDSFVFTVLGDLDEANSLLGLTKVKSKLTSRKLLTRVQKDIMTISSIISGCLKDDFDSRVNWLERKIKKLEEKVDLKKEFLLPGSSEIESLLNLARAVVRRAERRAIKLSKKQVAVGQAILNYLNRLSWLLFLLTQQEN